MFAIRYVKGNMVYKLYKVWILIGRWEEVADRLFEAWNNRKINMYQYNELAALCARAYMKELSEKENAAKVGA